MNLTKKRWFILLASCFICISIGSIYAWSVFSAPLAEHINTLKGTSLTPADLAIVFTVANAVGPITMISGGKLNDILGARKVILIGGCMFGAGLTICGFATSKAMLILGFGLVSGLGLGAAYGCCITNTVKFFPDRKGLIGGLTTAVYGCSSVIMPPLANALIDAFGITKALKGIGITIMIFVAIGSLFIENCPDGFFPDGYTPKSSGTGAIATDKDWRLMIKSPVFYVMLLMLTCGAFSGMMCSSQTSTVAQSVIGLTPATAALMVSMFALFNVGGRIIAGFLSDHIGELNTLRIALGLSLAGLFILASCRMGHMYLFATGLACIGLSFGSFMGVYPGFTASQFGSRHNGVNYGIMFIGFAFAGVFGPTTMGKILASTGSYTTAFFIAGLITVCGFVMSFIYKKVTRL